MFRKLFCFICLVLFSQTAKALTFEQYITDHDAPEMRAYLTGYTDAIHNNAYLLGACPRKLPYRPYGEYFQHIDIYITKKTKNKHTDLETFYNQPVEPLLTAVILKYADCNNPESRPLKTEPKNIQIEIRNLAKEIIKQTKKYQTPQEMEIEFAYKQHIDRLNNPKKYEKKCPSCPKPKPCPKPKEEKPVMTPPKFNQNAEEMLKVEIPKPNLRNRVEENKESLQQKSQTEATPKDTISHDVTTQTKEDMTPKHEIQHINNDIHQNIQKSMPLHNEGADASTKPEASTHTSQKEPVEELPSQQVGIKSETVDYKALDSIPNIPIPSATTKTPSIKEVNIMDVKAQKYELDSLQINLENLNDIKLSN